MIDIEDYIDRVYLCMICEEFYADSQIEVKEHIVASHPFDEDEDEVIKAEEKGEKYA